MPYRLFLELGMCYTFCIKRVHNRIKKQQMENKSDFEYIKKVRGKHDVAAGKNGNRRSGRNICWHSLKKFIKFLLQEYQIEGLGNVFQHTISR